ncbi:lef5 [Euproctis pseudoconspersa nucleopolyhedrovirus]|uniref:Lef5 n=1 Tax=Euproctis pseudoconspersa nucleopolyhedrovirus TaxID=307467 RepID=C3TWZ4_9ABAC|nr:lef5 [Euproctis pseudoconspersa nucleopolyhedrovirus]ACO53536.1 lef5 [Euproctis pseudoconspersa nucleopolyhedrovirus]
MTQLQISKISVTVDDQKVPENKGISQTKNGPAVALHNYNLFLLFKEFRKKKHYDGLIDFLVKNYPNNVKNKTFNFANTNHLFHSLYAYVPAITNVEKERKQIRLSKECIQKLFVNTINDFRLYTELFDVIRDNGMKEECPCQLLLQRREEIKLYVDMINQKKFDNKPPKLKKENIDNIMYKYSLNWKNLLLKRKTVETNINNKNSMKKKRKINKKNILTDEYIYLDNIDCTEKLDDINGMHLNVCQHKWRVLEKQLRAGDEAVSFIKYCDLCSQKYVQ